MFKTRTHSIWHKRVAAAIFSCALLLTGIGHVPAQAQEHAAIQQAKSKKDKQKQAKLTRLISDTKKIVLKKDGTQQISLQAVYSDKKKEDVTNLAEWESSNEEVVTVEAGLVTALESGKAKIKATYEGKSYTIPVEVDVVSRLMADQKKVALSIEGTKQVTLTAVYADKTTGVVSELAEWESADTEIVTVENGLVTAVGTGKTKIKATYGSKSVTLPVEVDVVSKLLPSTKKLSFNQAGATQAVTLTAQLSDGTKVDVTDKAEWSSDRLEVATVEGGNVTAVAPGKAKIKATYGGKTVTLPVEFKEVVKIPGLDVRNLTMKVGETKQVNVVLNGPKKTKEVVTEQAEWNSLHDEIATVEQGMVTAVKKGKTTIVAIYGGKLLKVQVHVK